MILVLRDDALGRQSFTQALAAATTRGLPRGRNWRYKVSGLTARPNDRRLIPRIVDGRDQAVLVSLVDEVLHRRFVLLEVDLDEHDAGYALERSGDVAHTRAAGHAFHVQSGGLHDSGFV